MKQLTYKAILVGLIALTGCNKSAVPEAGGRAATVTLKDGSTYSGSVVKSDTSALTLQSSTGESRTYPMTQVVALQYANDTPASPAPQPLPLPRQQPEPAKQTEEFRTIPAGATLQVRNNQSISSETANSGQTYTAVVARDVLDSTGNVAIPRGSNATLLVREANGHGKMQGRSELVLDLTAVSVDGRRYRLETADIVKQGKEGVGTNKRTAIFAGGGSALGGIIGALAGGGKGAAIGAISGAGAGTVTQAVTRGDALRVPSETLLSFKLEAAVNIRDTK